MVKITEEIKKPTVSFIETSILTEWINYIEYHLSGLPMGHKLYLLDQIKSRVIGSLNTTKEKDIMGRALGGLPKGINSMVLSNQNLMKYLKI